MRLDKLTIGSAKDSRTHHFKNLKNVTIDFDQGHWVTVVIGWNGTGKSNVLEALAIIFRDLIAKKRVPAFAFQLSYYMGAGETLRYVRIDADPDRDKEGIRVRIADAQQIKQNDLVNKLVDFSEDADTSPPGEALKLSAFLNAEGEYLPRYVFSYYSGESSRMHEIFLPYLKNYYQDLLNSEEDPAPKRLFYALPVHSQFVLLAFLIRPDEIVKKFMLDELGIDPEYGVESVLFVLREPPWNSKAGDDRFWYARGLVQRFLDRLMNASVAPISIKRKLPKSIWNKNTSEHEYKYLYIKDVESLRALVGEQSPNEFFRDLESTYVSELIEEVRIRVRLKTNDGSVTFRELSEGEQQLLTVLGLLRFTAEDESLFLLDEPDTHLNPRWCVDYISYLQKFIASGIQQEETSHVLLTTHNPLAIAELSREQVQILSREGESNNTTAMQPTFNPRGMGFAGLLTSDLFRLASSLDRVTQKALETEAMLSRKADLTEEEESRLATAQKILQGAEFRHAFMDPVMEEYSRARSELVEGNSKCADGLSEYPGSPLRRRIARKLLLKTLGISVDAKGGGKE